MDVPTRRTTKSTRLRHFSFSIAVLALACLSATTLADSILYHYDPLGRLIRAETDDGIVITYTYDAVGNRLSRRISFADLDGDGLPDSRDPDQDGDGMPDRYEGRYGFNPRDAADGEIDSDEDGFTNTQEAAGRSDPRDSASTPDTVRRDRLLLYQRLIESAL